MKYLVLLALCFANIAYADEAQSYEEKPSVEFVKDSFNYCVDYAEGEENADAVILECVNFDMESSGFKKFASMSEIKAFIK
ncbi:hypothetical protein [Paraferrimonas sp. SM1919]|uniref:hypothetical protein n=1 Tax=Paraferrimonas sp. SM1919 TaxID=2662263 RepID=UPI0013D32EC9|nr:hypothetical protein [Paraferrimonas sp. SM1919]